MDSPDSRIISHEEHWQITCHEAGHAIVAVMYGIPFLHVERGEGEYGVVELGTNPIDDPGGNWNESRLLHLQEFYAGGAAAEVLLFGDYRFYAVTHDKTCHEELKKKLNRCHCRGFEEDVESIANSLDRNAVEKVAKELDKRHRLTIEDVSKIIDCKLPWK